MTLIIANQKDERGLAWLQTQFTKAEIEAATDEVLVTGRNAYISNVTKALGTRIPDEVWNMPLSEINGYRDKLRALRDEIALKNQHQGSK